MVIEFDEELRNRLLAFQQRYGLADDGWAGAKTWRKLVEVAYGETGRPQTAAADAKEEAMAGDMLSVAASATIKPPKSPDAPDVLTSETIPITAEKRAPAEGRGRNTTPADRAELDRIRKDWNPEQPKERFHADHTRPFSQTPPGAEQKIRNRDAHRNMSEGGGQTRRENQARRQQPDWQDPKSPNYTRPVQKKGPKGQSDSGPKPPADPAAKPPTGPAPKPPADPAAKPPGSPAPKPPAEPPVKPPTGPGSKPPIDPVKPPTGPGPKPPVDPAVKPPSSPGMKALGSKLLGLAGEIGMTRALATDLEWLNTASDPKWGDTHVDMFGETWYRSRTDPGLWTTRPLPLA